jgi:hypothetical protein
MPIHITKITPDSGDPGDVFTVTIIGDVLSGVTKCSFGSEIDVGNLKVVDDGEITARLYINRTAKPGPVDVELINEAAGDRGQLKSGFRVR